LDVFQEMKELEWASGVEHALVTLPDGEMAIVAGGETGISGLDVENIIAHTHPMNYPGGAMPSAADIDSLTQLGQKQSIIIYRGQLYPFSAP
jgi:hypothetical protein